MPGLNIIGESTTGRTNIKNKYLFGLIILIQFLLVLFISRDVIGVDVGKSIIVLPILLYAFFSPLEYLCYLIALLLPLSFGASTGYIFPFIILLLLIRGNGPWWKSFLFATIIIISEVLHYHLYPALVPRFELSAILFLFYAFFFLSYFMSASKLNYDPSWFITFFCIGSAICMICILLHSVHEFGIVGVLSGYYRLGDEGIIDKVEEGGKIFFRANSNSMAYYSVVCISLISVLLRKKKINILLSLILLSVYFVAGVSTLSRTWAISLFTFLLLYILSLRKNRIKGLLALALVALISLIVLKQFDSVYMAFSDRFHNNTIETGGGRTLVFMAYHDYLMSNPAALFFGVGLMHQNFVCLIDNVAHVPHNAIQQIVVSYGLVGASILFFMFVKHVTRLYQLNKGGLLYLIPLIITIVFLQTIQVLYPTQLMLPLLPAICAISLCNK